MLKNEQNYFKNLAVWTQHIIFDHFPTSCIKILTIVQFRSPHNYTDTMGNNTSNNLQYKL